jgi:hypothetical protein
LADFVAEVGECWIEAAAGRFAEMGYRRVTNNAIELQQPRSFREGTQIWSRVRTMSALGQKRTFVEREWHVP